MPITKSAKKSLRVSITRREQNRVREIQLEKALRTVNEKTINEVISLIDKAAKTNLIHENKAARLKSRLAKKFSTVKVEKAKPAAEKAEKKAETKKATKKPVAKKEIAEKKTEAKKTAAKK